MDRYHRQTLLPQIGHEGQRRLADACVLLVGCGALGSVQAEQLVRAGVGTVRIVDRDIVELTNLQRQVLFDETDAKEQAPKAVAAARRLTKINSAVRVEPIVQDLHAGNIEQIAGLEGTGQRADLVLDGTDNVETRYLLNDVSVKHALPWVYGACVGTVGRVLAVRPPATACLRCLFEVPPAVGELPTCDTTGVFSPVAAVVASLQTTAALKLLAGHPEAVGDELYVLDLWNNRLHATSTAGMKRGDCPACGLGRFEFLDRPPGGGTASLCGRNAVQVRPPGGRGNIDLPALAVKLAAAGTVELTPYLVRCSLRESTELRLTLFADGRLIVQGTKDPIQARSLYARYIGN